MEGIMNPILLFQFLEGAIKGIYAISQKHHVVQFQFLEGAIKGI